MTGKLLWDEMRMRQTLTSRGKNLVRGTYSPCTKPWYWPVDLTPEKLAWQAAFLPGLALSNEEDGVMDRLRFYFWVAHYFQVKSCK